jgi:hypothetical protein
MLGDHRAAIKALLAPMPMQFYGSGQIPDLPTFPYAVLYMDTSVEDRTTLSGPTDEATFRFQVTSVGLTDDSAVVVADTARNLVLDVRPVVAGRTCTRIGKETSIPIREDRDVTITEANLHPIYGVDTYVFMSRKD